MNARAKKCDVYCCMKDATKHGWCYGHYARYIKHGSVMASTPLRITRAKGKKLSQAIKAGIRKKRMSRALRKYDRAVTKKTAGKGLRIVF